MKESSINRLKKMSAHLSQGCSQCAKINKHDDSGARCCDDIFCSIAKTHFMALGQSYEEVPLEDRIDKTVPYLSKNGCVIAPEHRPSCTMYACPMVLDISRNFSREYKRIHEKLKADPELAMLKELLPPALKNIVNGADAMMSDPKNKSMNDIFKGMFKKENK